MKYELCILSCPHVLPWNHFITLKTNTLHQFLSNTSVDVMKFHIVIVALTLMNDLKPWTHKSTWANSVVRNEISSMCWRMCNGRAHSTCGHKRDPSKRLCYRQLNLGNRVWRTSYIHSNGKGRQKTMTTRRLKLENKNMCVHLILTSLRRQCMHTTNLLLLDLK